MSRGMLLALGISIGASATLFGLTCMWWAERIRGRR